MGALKLVGLFAGIGGIELGFRRALGDRVETSLLCESWSPAQAVLAARFPETELQPDIRTLASLPADADVVAAGFPCTDLSQAGRTAGITGLQSGLVAHLFELLRSPVRRKALPTLVIENVPNMLALDRGAAMRYLVDQLEELGYQWAYRVVDSRFVGLPQRRRRVVLVASVELEPSSVLFADEAGVPDDSRYDDVAFGFYWTEGKGGLGWAQDALPTLKGGSTVGIASPPAIWIRQSQAGRRLVTPTLEDAEVLQGFPSGWTAPAQTVSRNGPRWKLVGNAVTVDVAAWVAGRIARPGQIDAESKPWSGAGGAWPPAAHGACGRVHHVAASEYPQLKPYQHLVDLVDSRRCAPLSHRAARGFWHRLQQGNLGQHPGFRKDVFEHVQMTALQQEQLAI